MIRYVAFDKFIILIFGYILQVLEIAAVGKLVKVDDLVIFVFGKNMPYEVGTDKAGSSGDEYIFLHLHLPSASATRLFALRSDSKVPHPSTIRREYYMKFALFEIRIIDVRYLKLPLPEGLRVLIISNTWLSYI